MSHGTTALGGPTTLITAVHVILYVVLYVHDQERSRAFYQAALGLAPRLHVLVLRLGCRLRSGSVGCVIVRDERRSADPVTDVALRTSTPAERAALLALMHAELAERRDRTLALLGMTWPQFEALFASRGEVRTIEVAGVVAGYVWIERRGRDLHLHAIVVVARCRGRGVGSAALSALEVEFAARADAVEVGVEEGNARARAWYLRQGYRVTRTLPDLRFEVLRKSLADRASGGSDGVSR